MLEALYFLVALGASIVGAISGIGGGVIIKPVLDAVSQFDSVVIGMLSAFSVLSMAVTSVIKHAINKTPFDKKTTVFLGIGAILGGIAGDLIFNYIQSNSNDNVVKVAQGVALILLLAFVLLYMNVIRKKQQAKQEAEQQAKQIAESKETYDEQSDTQHSDNAQEGNIPVATKKRLANNPVIIILIGLALGMVSSFIGIGGGPINIAILCFVFRMDMKSATINSLVLIVFSQTAKIVRTAISGTFATIEMPWVLVALMVAGAVIGGFIGTIINKRVSNRALLIVYNVALLSIVAINIYNITVNAIALA